MEENKKSRVHGIQRRTENPFLNLYEYDVTDTKGVHHPYYVASRAKDAEKLKSRTRRNTPDGVVIYALSEGEQERVVLIRQYRYSIDDYIYEFPAGLVDPGETAAEAAVREFREETGMVLQPIPAAERYTRPYFTTIGMTDEACAAVYGTASGTVSAAGLEDTEEIEVILADRREVKRILQEEHVSLMCAYMLMHFLHSAPGAAFSFLQEK